MANGGGPSGGLKRVLCALTAFSPLLDNLTGVLGVLGVTGSAYWTGFIPNDNRFDGDSGAYYCVVTGYGLNFVDVRCCISVGVFFLLCKAGLMGAWGSGICWL